MKRLNPDQLYVEFRNGVTKTNPIIGRKYTLTHSDITAELFLTIGRRIAYDKVNSMRDEVLAEWITYNGLPFLFVYVYVDGQFGPAVAAIRNTIFRSELPLALEAIRYGDKEVFNSKPELNTAPIGIHFDSTIKEYNKFEYWGTPSDYE